MRMVLGAVLSLSLLGPICAQDVISLKPRHIKVLAEDSKVRVLRFAPSKGDKTPMHSHPETVAYVVKGGKIRTILPDGTSSVRELVTGDAALRAPVTHADEALDDLEVIIVELKN